MPVPFLVPILGAMAGTIAGPALGLGAAAAAGGAAATGVGSLLASAAPAALGSGIATLAAGGDPREALMNAALAGAGSAAMPGVTSALQGVGGAAAPQAAASGAPAASLRPMMRPTDLTAAAQPAAPAAGGGSGLMDNLGKVKDITRMMGSEEQSAPMPAPQIIGAQPRAAASGSPFGNILVVQPQPTPTAMSYIRNPSVASSPETNMSMLPESLNTGIGLLRPRPQDTEQDFSMARGGIM